MRPCIIHQNRKMLVVFVTMLMLLVSITVAFADDSISAGIDLIVLIDNGYSLTNTDNPTDKTGYRFDAVASAISMLEGKKSRANYALFNQNVQTFSDNKKLETIGKNKTLPIYDISLSLGRSKRLQMLNELTASNLVRSKNASGGTDIGQALNYAIETLLRDDSGNKKVIILFTDGAIRFVNNNDLSERQKQKQYDTSYDLAIDAHNRAEQQGITIHTVLLEDASAIEFMRDEVRTSDGLFFLATDSNQLPDIFAQIYAHEVNSTILAANSITKENSSMTFSVPNSNAKSLNIMLPLAHMDAASLTLTSPSGRVFTDNQQDFYTVTSNQYAIYKVLSPEKGEWILSYIGDDSQSMITAEYILDYDVELTGMVSETNVSKADSITITAFYNDVDGSACDTDLYDVPAYLQLSKGNQKIKQVTMEKSDSCYSYTFSPNELGAGEYDVSIHTEGQGFLRNGSALAFTVMNKSPYLNDKDSEIICEFAINDPLIETSYDVQSQSWDLTDYITDPDGDNLVFSISSVPCGVTADIAKGILTISTKKNTEANEDIIVSVRDQDGLQGPDLIFHVNTTSLEKKLSTLVYGPTHSLTKNSDTATIQLQYVEDGTTLTTGDYYTMPAMVTIKKDNKVLKSGLEMTYDGKEYTYTIDSLKQYGAGTFIIEIRIQNGRFLMDCEPLTIQLDNGMPMLIDGHDENSNVDFQINILGDPNSYLPQTQTIDLSEIVADPDGDLLTWNVETNDASVNASVSGSILSITTKKNTPTSGKIVVSVKDTDGAAGPTLTFDVTVVSVQDSVKESLGLIVYAPSQPLTKENDSTIIRAQYTENGTTLTKSDYYSLPAVITLKKNDQVLKSAIPMEYNGTEYICTLDGLKQYGAGLFSIEVRIQYNGFVLDSTPITIQLGNADPVLADRHESIINHEFSINIPGKPDSYIPQTWAIDLSEIVIDPDGDDLFWNIEPYDVSVNASISGSVLSITTQKDTPTSGNINISVRDKDGAIGPTLTFEISVVSVQNELKDSLSTIVYGPTQPLTKSNDSATIRVQYTENGTTLTESDYYSLPASMTLKKNDKVLQSGLTMSYNGSEYSYTLEGLKRYGAGTFVIEIRIQDRSFILDCTPISIQLEDTAPILANGYTLTTSHEFDINIPGDVNSYSQQSWAIDLSKILIDPDGDPITWNIEPYDVAVNVNLYGSTLQITTKLNTPTNGDIVISSSDSDGKSGPDLTFSISVIAIEDVYEKYTASIKPISGNKNSDVEIITTVYNENKKKVVNDTYLPTSCVAKVSFEDEEFSIVLNRQESGEYVGQLHTRPVETEYSIVAQVSVGGKTISSKPLSFTTINQVPTTKKSLSEAMSQTVYLGITKDICIDLNDFFADPDDDRLSYAIDKCDSPEKISLTIDGNILTIHPAEANFCFPADVSFVISASDTENGKINGDVISIKILPIIIQIIIALIVAIVLFAIILFIHWKNAHFGHTAFDVSYGFQGLELPDAISDPLPYRSHQTISLGNYYTELARTACDQQISLESIEKILVKPLSRDRIKIVIPEGLTVHAFKQDVVDFDISNQRYVGNNEMSKGIIKVGDYLTICHNDCRVSFKLIHIQNSKQSNN